MTPLERRTVASSAEAMEEEGLDPDELREALEGLDDFHRRFGGWRGLRSALRPRFLRLRGEADPGADRPEVTLLDLGAGSGTLLRRACGLAEECGLRPRGLAVDLHPDVVRLTAVSHGAAQGIPADSDPVRALRADALRLPLVDRSVDWVLSSLTLHHFDRDDALRLLGEAARVARRGVLVHDLERHRLAWWGARLLAGTLWAGRRLCAEDGPVSVLRARTAPEMLELAEAAGWADPQVRRLIPWQLILVGDGVGATGPGAVS